YIDFDKNGYTVNYNRFTSDYVFDRDVYCGYDYDAKIIISVSFGEDPSSLLKTLVYNIEVEYFHSYFVGQQSIWVHAANS
ncbi:MAG: Pretoxin domain, partial [Pseudomonadota bacterium]